MAKVRTTLTIDDEVLRAVKHRAARGGQRESEVIEEALRRELGIDLLDQLWSRGDMSEKDASKLAVEAQHRTRLGRSRRKRR
jgi:predicted CopG family antitoxin